MAAVYFLEKEIWRECEMINVLVIAGTLYIGGAERVCRNIGYFADPVEFRIDYLVFGEKEEAYEAELLEKGSRIFHVSSPSEGYFKFYKDLKKLIQENHYDVVHSHTMFNSGLVLRAAKRCSVPVRIAHSHSIKGPEHRSLIQNLYEKTMRRWILRDATHLIGCGQAAGEWLFGQKAFQQRGIVLLNGIELDRLAFNPAWREEIRQKHHWESSFVIGHAGHMVPVKNQAFLLRLMPEVIKKKPETKLVLLGDGSDRTALEQMASDLGIADHVVFTGNVQNVNQYLSAMDVFAFPSLYEGMPLAIMEAQANGLPCVLSDRVPKDVFLTDLVQELPLESEPENWADALLQAKRSEPSRYADELNARGFDTRTVMEKIFAIYDGG